MIVLKIVLILIIGYGALRLYLWRVEVNARERVQEELEWQAFLYANEDPYLTGDFNEPAHP